MATVQRYVNTASTAGTQDGTTDVAGNSGTAAFESLSKWESTMGAGNGADTYIVDCCGTAADTTAVTVNFAAAAISIRGYAGHVSGKYDGTAVLSSSFYRLAVGGSALILNATTNFTVDGIQVNITASGAYTGIDIAGAKGTTIVKNCRVIETSGGTNSGVGIGTAATTGTNSAYTYTYDNNLVINFASGIRHGVSNFWTQQITIRHNTIYGNGGTCYGVHLKDAAGTADASYFVYGNAICGTGSSVSIFPEFISTGGAGGATYADNACSIASGTTDEIVLSSESATWTTAGSTAASVFTVKDTSSVLYSAVNPTRVTTDIVGFTRDGSNHDVGAFELQAPAGGLSLLQRRGGGFVAMNGNLG